MDLKRIYYYIISLTALFVLFWGLVDFSSASLGLLTARIPPAFSAAPDKETEPALDIYYQKKMLSDKLVDSLARILVSGLVFAYCRKKAD